MAKKETKDAQVNLRLQPSLKRAAEKAAADDRRSLTSLIEKLLVDHLKSRNKRKQRKGSEQLSLYGE